MYESFHTGLDTQTRCALQHNIPGALPTTQQFSLSANRELQSQSPHRSRAQQERCFAPAYCCQGTKSLSTWKPIHNRGMIPVMTCTARYSEDNNIACGAPGGMTACKQQHYRHTTSLHYQHCNNAKSVLDQLLSIPKLIILRHIVLRQDSTQQSIPNMQMMVYPHIKQPWCSLNHPHHTTPSSRLYSWVDYTQDMPRANTHINPTSVLIILRGKGRHRIWEACTAHTPPVNNKAV